MRISRRSFLKYCGASAALLGFGPRELRVLANALRNPAGPTVVWLEGLACSGCSVSFLNHLSTTAPHDAADVLIDVINLNYHSTIMASAGETAVDAAYQAYNSGSFVLVVEGSVPTAFGGRACLAWADTRLDVVVPNLAGFSSCMAGPDNGLGSGCTAFDFDCDSDVDLVDFASAQRALGTFQEVVQQFAARATAVVCVGQCSAFGGLPAAPPNPTGSVSVSALTGLSTINVAGCPPHPAWIVWVIAQLVAGNPIEVDGYGRPTAIFSAAVHDNCPLRNTQKATQWNQETRCKELLGCRGPATPAPCPNQLFNGGVNWCIGAGSLCIGCTSASFPGTSPFFQWAK